MGSGTTLAYSVIYEAHALLLLRYYLSLYPDLETGEQKGEIVTHWGTSS